MAQPGRSILKMIFTNFINSLKPRKFQGELVGKDILGNRYYQIIGGGRQRTQRWFDPKDKDDFEQNIPAEWESWLRYRRKDPPSEAEILANAALAEQKKLNAALIEPQKATQVDDSKTELKGSAFPRYEEYEVIPGKPQGKKNNE